jgi:hypothetical protein
MTALIIGILFILFSVLAVLPELSWGLQWGAEVLAFIKGSVPILVLFIGLVAVLIGIADIKDRSSEKKIAGEHTSDDSGE